MLKDSMILTFSKGIRGILMLIFNMVIARIFSESTYGTYKHINLIVNMLSAICILGIPTTVSYFYSTYDREKKEKLIGNTITILISISLITSIVIFFAKNFIVVTLNNNDLLRYISLIAIYTAIMILSSFLENLYIASDNSVLLGKVYVVYTISNFIIMVSSILIFKDLYLLIKGIVIIESLRSIIMYILVQRNEKLSLKVDINMLKGQVRFALPLGVVALVQSINGYVDNLFVSNKYTPDKYAAFANAATDIPLVSIVTVSIAAVILPKMSKVYKESNNGSKVLSLWGESCEKTAVIMYPIFWAVLLFSTGYIDIIFSEKYVTASTPIFIIYLMKFPLYCTVFGNILIVLGKQKYIMYNSIIGILLNIVLNAVFINIFAMNGPAYATVLVQYIVVYLQIRQIAKCLNIKVSRVMPYKKLIKIFIIPVPIAFISYSLSIAIGVRASIALIVFGPIIYVISILIYMKLSYIDIDVKKFIKKK